MALIDELKEKRAEAIAALETQQEFVRAHQINVIDWRHMVEDLDRAIAALEPTPAPVPEPETQTGEGVEIPEGFTKWEGGGCPVDPAALVCVVTRSGKLEQFHAGTFANPDVLFDQWQWSNYRRDDDIIAYRVSLPAPTPEDEPETQPELYDEPQEIEASSQSESCVPSLGAETDLQTSPGEAEESRDQFEEEAQLAAAIELTADVEPVLEPQEPYPDAEPLPEPEWNEPQTEGYAPVTNPTIDDLIPKAMRQELEAEQRYAQPTNPEADFWARGLAPSEPEKKHRFSIFGHKRETEDA